MDQLIEIDRIDGNDSGGTVIDCELETAVPDTEVVPASEGNITSPPTISPADLDSGSCGESESTEESSNPVSATAPAVRYPVRNRHPPDHYQ